MNRLVFQKKLIIEDSLQIPPYTHITFFGWRLAFGVVGDDSLWLPQNHFHSTLLYSIHFSLPVTICFKNRMFLLHLSRDSYVEIRSRRFLSTSLMWNPNIKVINITNLVQMIFNAWFAYFEYASYLPCGITLIVLNYCFNLILINFDWSTLSSSNVQRQISSMKLCKPLKK